MVRVWSFNIILTKDEKLWRSEETKEKGVYASSGSKWWEEKYRGKLIENRVILSFFLRFDLFIFRQSGREGEREGEKQQCVVASHVPSTEDLAHNPGMCPHWESNQWPFGSQPTLNPLSYTSQGKFFLVHTDMTAVTIQSNKIVSNEIKDN